MCQLIALGSKSRLGQFSCIPSKAAPFHFLLPLHDGVFTTQIMQLLSSHTFSQVTSRTPLHIFTSPSQTSCTNPAPNLRTLASCKPYFFFLPTPHHQTHSPSTLLPHPIRRDPAPWSRIPSICRLTPHMRDALASDDAADPMPDGTLRQPLLLALPDSLSLGWLPWNVIPCTLIYMGAEQSIGNQLRVSEKQ